MARKKDTGEIRGTTSTGRDRIGIVLYMVNVAAIIISIIFIVRIIKIQFFFHPDERLVEMFTPSSAKTILQPVRGTIMADDGSLLATSFPSYRIEMDPSIRKGEFAAVEDEKLRTAYEDTLKAKIGRLSVRLAEVFPEKNAETWKKTILDARAENKGNLVLAKQVDYFTMKQIEQFPLFDEGRFKGGIKITQVPARQYPYGALAKSTIGSVADTFTTRKNTLELRYDKELRGENGYEYTRTIDRRQRIQDYDSTYRQPVDGYDVKTTINIRLQDIADRSLRNNIEAETKNLDYACAAIMEVKTGAVKAMVNLTNTDGVWRENYNHVLNHLGEPGSVFKSVVLTAAMVDGYVKSSLETIPIRPSEGAGVATLGPIHGDRHVSEYLSQHPGNEMQIRFGFMRSSNYTFVYLLDHYYRSQSKKFYQHLHDWHLDDSIHFELSPTAKPTNRFYDSEHPVSGTLISFQSMGFGYTIRITPMHLLMFYNAIANGGKMMNPYIVSSIEKEGKVYEQFAPRQIATVCSPEIADSLNVTMRTVTGGDPRSYRGTAARSMGGARSTVAGKTGSAFIYLEAKDVPGGRANISGNGQHTLDGRCKKQATFVGFFPAENPQYSVIVTLYTRLGPWSSEFDGGGIPALVVKDIVNALYTTDGFWNESASEGPAAEATALPTATPTSDGTVPDLKGLSLSDALWAAEKSGFTIKWTGEGKVASQTPAAGKNAIQGTPIQVVLKR